jgi:arsenate reductase-like glutaredoxin family protein
MEAFVLQIIGTKSCNETKKAIRYCKERSINFQFIDLKVDKLSDGVYKKIFQNVELEDLIDTKSNYYVKNGYQYIEYDITEEVVEHPELLKTPILRDKNRATVGFDETFIEQFRS